MLNIIVAYDKNMTIGKDNKIPWHLKDDMIHFKNLTINKTIIMGRKTYESIGFKPLPKRKNIVITRDKNFDPKNGKVKILNNIEDLRKYENTSEDFFIIGGEQIYKKTLEMGIINKIYATEIEKTFEGDTYFPKIDKNIWQIEEKEEKSENKIKFYYVTYKKMK